MPCANNAATDAAARMRAPGGQSYQDSAAGVPSTAADDEQPATPNVAGERGHPLRLLQLVVPWTLIPS